MLEITPAMQKYEIREWCDLFHVQRGVRAFSAGLGFTRRGCGELAIVATELASNILKHAGRGIMEARAVSDARGSGLALVAADSGQPFFDLEAALRDGWDDRGPIDPAQMLTRKGFGGGLGAVVRLTHSFRVDAEAHGKRVHVVRYLQVPK